MRFSIAAIATALVGTTLATDHVVVVGKSNLSFVPDTITAAEGDTVTFKFWPKNHSVAQAAFNKPCEPMNNGFWSGFMPTTDTSAASPNTFMYTVTNKSQPIWFYCSFMKHCQNGMVGVINPPASGNTVEKFAANAKNATENVSPTSEAGTGGMIMSNGSSMNGSSAASTLSTNNNNLAFAGLLGMAVYLAL